MRRTYRYKFEKPKEENKPTVKETKKRSRISPPRRKIYSFQDLKISDDCGSIDLTKKSIETFVGLPNLEYLIRLNLDSNPLRSFEGSPKLPNLRWLSARNSPISRNPYFKLMAVIVFGNKLATINNEKVMPQIHQQATAFRDSLYPELLKGRIIANLCPLRFIDTKNDIVVNAEPSILAATKKIGYKAPAVQEFERTIVERSREQFRIPSVATICDGIIEREDEKNNNYLPDKFMDDFLSQLHDLRVKYNSKYENSSSEYDSEEEAINESTQSQESINDASPIKPPRADNIAKHLIRSESDSELKMSQSNIEEEANDNVSYHSNLQDNLLIEEEEEEKNEQIKSEKNEEEEKENENIEKENENIEKEDDIEMKEEEEENQKIQTLEEHQNEEEEENQKIQALEEHQNEEEEEGKNEKENENNEDSIDKKESNEEENENENKDEPSIDTNALNEEEEKTETKNKNEEEEEEQEAKNQNNSEEEDKKIEIQNNSEEEDKKIENQNNSEEEEKSENNKSAEDLDQNQDEEEETNLSENSSVKDED